MLVGERERLGLTSKRAIGAIGPKISSCITRASRGTSAQDDRREEVAAAGNRAAGESTRAPRATASTSPASRPTWRAADHGAEPTPASVPRPMRICPMRSRSVAVNSVATGPLDVEAVGGGAGRPAVAHLGRTAPSTAASRSASAKTTKGAQPAELGRDAQDLLGAPRSGGARPARAGEGQLAEAPSPSSPSVAPSWDETMTLRTPAGRPARAGSPRGRAPRAGSARRAAGRRCSRRPGRGRSRAPEPRGGSSRARPSGRGRPACAPPGAGSRRRASSGCDPEIRTASSANHSR